LQALALIVTLRVSGAHPRWIRAGFALVIVVAVLAAALSMSSLDSARTLVVALWGLLALLTPIAVLRRLTRYSQVSVQVVLGLLVVYLMIGLVFSYIYMICQLAVPGAFSQPKVGISEATYFSYITLATVGYGDITPGNSVVRAFAVLEAMLGSLYIVSVVSIAVGSFSRQRGGGA
ncbi:MAG: two pore domain potassium channel family protein, partial [Actinobacteria bacterium]